MEDGKKLIKKAENLFQMKVDDVLVEMVYSENNRSFNECMLEILRRKIKTGYYI